MKAMLGLCAAGTLPRDEAIVLPGFARRVRLVFEILIFFVGAPLLVSYVLQTFRLPLFVVLQPILLGFFLYLMWDPTFFLRRELAQGFSLGQLLAILGTFAVIGSAIAYAAYALFPWSFLSFPRRAPQLWCFIRCCRSWCRNSFTELSFFTATAHYSEIAAGSPFSQTQPCFLSGISFLRTGSRWWARFSRDCFLPTAMM